MSDSHIPGASADLISNRVKSSFLIPPANLSRVNSRCKASESRKHYPCSISFRQPLRSKKHSQLRLISGKSAPQLFGRLYTRISLPTSIWNELFRLTIASTLSPPSQVAYRSVVIQFWRSQGEWAEYTPENFPSDVPAFRHAALASVG